MRHADGECRHARSRTCSIVATMHHTWLRLQRGKISMRVKWRCCRCSQIWKEKKKRPCRSCGYDKVEVIHAS